MKENIKKIIITISMFMALLLPWFCVLAQDGDLDLAPDQAQQLQQIQQLQKQIDQQGNQRNGRVTMPSIAQSQGQPGQGGIAPAATNPNMANVNQATPVAAAVPAATGNQNAGIIPGPPPVASASTDVSENDIRNAAFDTMAKNALPMSPDQIQKLRQLFNQTQAAAAATPGTPPRPTATSQFVDLSPGSTPPVIRLSQGFVSSLVFLDSTGAPWPIDNYDIGNPAAFNIQWNKTDNTLLIQSLTLYTYGNLAVRLQGLNTPVMLTLIPGQKAVDYRVDLRIQGLGPNAKPPMGNGLPSTADPVLLGVLDGIPPTGSKSVHVEGGDADAWVTDDRLYIRTHFTILSPAWLATMTSADGTKAYAIVKPSLQNAVLLASQNGKIVQLKIEGL